MVGTGWTRSGWMTKHRSFDGYWKDKLPLTNNMRERFFVLKGHELEYYKGSSDQKPKGVVRIDGDTLIEDASKATDRKFAIGLHSPVQGLSFVLIAASEDDAAGWRRSLLECVEECKQQEMEHPEPQGARRKTSTLSTKSFMRIPRNRLSEAASMARARSLNFARRAHVDAVHDNQDQDHAASPPSLSPSPPSSSGLMAAPVAKPHRRVPSFKGGKDDKGGKDKDKDKDKEEKEGKDEKSAKAVVVVSVVEPEPAAPSPKPSPSSSHPQSQSQPQPQSQPGGAHFEVRFPTGPLGLVFGNAEAANGVWGLPIVHTTGASLAHNLTVGDVITHINNAPIQPHTTVNTAVAAITTALQGEGEGEGGVVLRGHKAQGEPPSAVELRVSHRPFGFTVAPSPSGLRVVHVEREGEAERAGVRLGHCVRAVGGKEAAGMGVVQFVGAFNAAVLPFALSLA